MDILTSLNKKQKEAVLTTEGPVLILAGAGSGKTRALTYRIAYLIQEKSILPENILAVTFTNKAANEMKQRVYSLLQNSKLETLNSKETQNSKNQNPKFSIRNTQYAIQNTSQKSFQLFWMGTFHSICVKILRREAGRGSEIEPNFIIYDSSDSLRAVKRAMRSLEISEKKYNPRAIRTFISQAKGELISAKAYKGYVFEHFQKTVAEVYLEYEKLLRKSNALDFDDLILKTVELFQNSPSILEKYQRRFKYILVDEYQDTNHAQYIFLKTLAKAHQNIFVIGDDWQSIYSFRGAKFQNILDFKKDYPGAKIIYLEENYRSTTPILEAAQQVIKQNEIRSDKNLFTRQSGGAPVAVMAFSDKQSEIEFIVDEIMSLQTGESRELQDFTVLYRTNAQSRIFEEVLIRRGVPYRIFGAIRFYERREIKDILAYLILIQSPSDVIALSRVINIPPRGIGEKTLEKIIASGDKAPEIVPKSETFFSLLNELRAKSKNLKPNEIIELILTKSGYKDYLTDGTPESEGRLENIEELKNAAAQYEDLPSFLETVSLISDIDNYDKNENALTLMTVHSAKGLEFPVVFISGLEEGLFPHIQSMEDQAELEEERRLMYVGMTRAKERLYLSYAKMRIMYGRLEATAPSRFLEELPQEKIEIIEL